MPNQPESIQFLISERRRFNILMAIFMIIVTAFIVYIFVKVPNNNNGDERAINKALAGITKSFDSLKIKYWDLEKKGTEIEGQLSNLRYDREELFRRLAISENKLATIKKEYEKINSYTDISIDSLHSIFSTRFKR
jgi:ABC-type cobalt transport system substrate-binding protein